MRKNLIFAGLMVIILTLSSLIVFAGVDDQGNPNDPTVNDRANACFEDGAMEGKCDTDWEWECGWYLIRFDYGIISLEDYPSWCGSPVPPTPEPDTDTSSVSVDGGHVSNCAGPLWGFAYIQFGSTNFVPAPVTVYSNSACTLTYNTLPYSVAYASSLTQANSICVANEPGTTAESLSGNVYRCTTAT